MWGVKGFTILVRSENIPSIIGRNYASFICTFKLRSPVAVSPVLTSRTYKSSNRYKFAKKNKFELKMSQEMKKVYGVSDKEEYNHKEWLKKHYFSEFKAFQARLDIKFNDHKILMSAFAHPSFLEDLKLIQRDDVSSEETDMVRRFELKDEVSDIPFQKLSLLGYDTSALAIKEEIYKKYPNISSSVCSDVSKFLTSRDVITMVAKNLAIEDLLLLSRELENIENFEEEYHLKFTKEDLLCDAFYSLVGAIVKDLGVGAAKDFVNDFVTVLMNYEDLSEHVQLDCSIAIEELKKILSLNGVPGGARARTIAEAGVTSDFPFFITGIYCNGCKLADGSGYSAFTAKTDAFKNAVFSCLEGDVNFSRLRKNAK